MKNITLILVLFITQFLHAEFKIVAYIPTYTALYNTPSNIPFESLTHINIAFAQVDVSGNVSVSNGAKLNEIVSLANDKNVKVLLSIGGGSTKNQYINILGNETSRSYFIKNLLSMVNTYGLSGLDIDLEGDDITKDYETFVLELGDSLHAKGRLITAALGTWGVDGISDNSLNVFDFINIMAYDHTGSWAPNNPGPHSSFEQAFADLNYWLKDRGLAASKAILGVPFYGYEFKSNNTSSAWRYSQIVDAYFDAENKDIIGNTIYYNGIPTIKDKTKLAINKGGGVMIWELSQDSQVKSKSLLNAIVETAPVGDIDKVELGLSIFPNPNKGIFKIEHRQEMIGIRLFNTLGEQVKYYNTNNQKAFYVNESDDLKKGVYCLEIITSERRTSTKIVVE